MTNLYEKTPFKIHIYDPIGAKIIRSFILIGNAPPAVQKAINTKNTNLLKQFYGQHYAKLLMLGQKHGGDIGGEDHDEQLDNQYSHEHKLLQLGGKLPPSITPNEPESIVAIKSGIYKNSLLLHGLKTKTQQWTLGGDGKNINDYDNENDNKNINDYNTKIDDENIKISDDYNYKIGGDVDDYEDIELTAEDIARVSSEKPKVSAVEDIDVSINFKQGVEYVPHNYVFPEDNFAEIKDKVFLITGIPVYRQHLFYSDGITLYRLYTESLVDTDIRKLNKTDSTTQYIAGIPIDRQLFDASESIKVEAYDTFQIINGITEVFIVDLNMFVEKIRVQLIDILRDAYQRNMFYYGFIIKFWPQLSEEVFQDYLNNEKILYQKYPDLARQISYLKPKYSNEADILNEMYNNVHANATHVTLAITRAVVSVTGSNVTINIRNLFDALHVSKCLPEIHAYVVPPFQKRYERKMYMLKKVLKRSDINIPFPGVGEPIFHSGIIIAINLRKKDQDNLQTSISSMTTAEIKHLFEETVSTKSASIIENEQFKYMFINIQPDGKYFVRTIWNEEDAMDFTKLQAVVAKFMDPFIDKINTLGKYVFPMGGKLARFSESQFSYSSLNISIYWKKVLSEQNFKLIQEQFTNYIRGGIFEPKGLSTQNELNFLFRKGMHEFDPRRIDRILVATGTITTPNYYLHLTDNIVKLKWIALYSGRNFRIVHRTSDTRFEINNCTESEFKIFNRIIKNLINQLAKLKFSDISHQEFGKKVKRMKKLKELDPELYNLKKHGSKKLYSILCQNPKQPFIYTDEEYRVLTKEQKLKLVKYWNFTLNKPAYYGCPKGFPNLSFRADVHPKHYCMPCCKKSEGVEETKRVNIDNICLSDYRYNVNEAVSDDVTSKNTIKYGKKLERGRLMRFPDSLQNLFDNIDYDKPADINFHILGVYQNFPAAPTVGVLYSIAEILDVKIDALILSYSKSVEDHFHYLLNGSILNYFKNAKELSSVIKRIFISGEHVLLNNFFRWNELFIELAEIVNGLFIITFVDADSSGGNIQIKMRDTITGIGDQLSQYKFAFIMNIREKYFPIFEFSNTYYKTGKINKRIYEHNHPLIGYFLGAIKSSSKVRVWNYLMLKKLLPNNYKLVKKFMNMQNKCYGVMLNYHGKSIYIPVIADVTGNDDVPKTFDLVKGMQNNRTDIQHFLSSVNFKGTLINITLGKTMSYNGKTVAVEFIINDKIFPAYVARVSSNEPGIVLHYDPNIVNQIILDRKPPIKDNRTRLLGRALYSNYEYQLFLLSFANYIENDRNKEKRNALIKDISSAKIENRSDIFGIISKHLTGDDMIFMKHRVVITINKHGLKTDIIKQDLIDYINANVFEFDKTTLNKLKNIKHKNELKNEIKDIANKFAIEKAIEAKEIEMPNIFLPCSEVSEDYCSGNKMMVKSLDTLISLLTDDLRNPLKSRYLLNRIFTTNIIEFFQFKTHEYETVVVLKTNKY